MKKKILVVDDDRVMLKFVTNLLEREGHKVVTAEDGFAALNLLTAFTPDIMFFDLVMPKIEGDKLCHIVRTMPHLNDCYLIIVSALIAELDFNYMEIGADSYIAKGPFAQMAEHILAAVATSDAPRKNDQTKPIRGLETVYARQLTKELLSRNRHLETILESMSEAILEVYSEKVVYANSAALSLFGAPQEKLLTSYPPDLFDAGLRPKLKAMLKSGTGRPSEIGTNAPVELNGRLVTIKSLPVKGEAATTIIMITDVTEQRRLELQLQHAQKMEAIGTIASGVAHNFRNTLNEILVNSQVIQMNYEDKDGLHAVAERINTSVKRGAGLVDGLLQFSRKQIKKEFQKVDLVTVINEVCQIIKKSFGQKIDIHTKLADTLPVLGDHSALGLALMNLFNNARDAMPDGGQLCIEAKKRKDRAVVVVSDTGHGMDQETKEKCFDPFFTTKALGRGTGLGLSTTYGIVKGHEGTIYVESNPDKGVRFKITFPLASDIEEDMLEPPAEIVRGRGQRILVVDDEMEIHKAIKDLIEGLGYRCRFAGTKEETVDLYKSWCPAIVILDLGLPMISGVELIKTLTNHDPNVKIVVIGGYSPEKDEITEVMKMSAVKGHLHKPIALAELSGVLAKVLERRA